MTRYLFSILIILSSYFQLNAQVKVSVNESCLTKNSLLLSKLLISSFGEEYVNKLLENDVRILIFFHLNKLGEFSYYQSRIGQNIDTNQGSIEFEHIFSQNEIQNVKYDFEHNLKIPIGYFEVCYDRLPDQSDSAIVAIISKDIFNKGDQILINVGFPGEIMLLYVSEKEKAAKNEITLSKLEFLKELINKNSH